MRMTRIVDTSLDTLSKSHTIRGLLVLEIVIDLLGKKLSHEIRVLRKIRHLSWTFTINGKGGVLLRAVVWSIATAKLNPSLKLLHGRRNPSRWVGIWISRSCRSSSSTAHELRNSSLDLSIIASIQ